MSDFFRQFYASAQLTSTSIWVIIGELLNDSGLGIVSSRAQFLWNTDSGLDGSIICSDIINVHFRLSCHAHVFQFFHL